MVNLTSVSAVSAEPAAAAPSQPGRARIEASGPGAFARLLAGGDGASADHAATERDSDPADEATDSDSDKVADPAAALLDPPLATVPNEKLTAAMNEGVGAVLALLAAMPAPTSAALPVTSAAPAPDNATGAITAMTPTKAAIMPAIVGFNPMAATPAANPGAPIAIPAPAVVSTTDMPEGIPQAADSETAPAAPPPPRQDVPAMLAMLRTAFGATSVAPVPTAASTPRPSAPLTSTSDAAPLVDTVSPIPVATLPAGAAAAGEAADVPIDAEPVQPPATTGPVSLATAPLRAVAAQAADVPSQPESAAPGVPNATASADPAPESSGVPAPPAVVATDMPRPASVSASAALAPEAAIAMAPIEQPAAPLVPVKIQPAATPPLEATDAKPIVPEPPRPQAAAAPVAPIQIQPVQMAPDIPKPAPLREKDEDRRVAAADAITGDTAPIMASSAPVVATSAVETGAAITDAQPSQSQQSITRHLDLARDSQWLDRLAQDISQAATRNGHLKFQLNPEHLGSLQVEITNSAAGTAVRMTADTDTARAIIADAQPRLVAEARAQGLRISETHVDLGNQAGSGGAGGRQPSSEDHKPFVRTQAATRAEISDSPARSDDERYA